MDEYQGMNQPMRVDMGHGRYGRTQYMDTYAAAPVGAHAGYEWNAYAAPGMAHGSAPRSGALRGPAQSLRSKIAERLQQIDRDAVETRERRYQQKAEEIQSELTQILRGVHPAFADGVTRLVHERDRTILSAEESHAYLLAQHERTYRHEREQAEHAYTAERQAVFDKIAADIDERRKRLKDEKDSLDISADFVLDSGARAASRRNLRKRGMELGVVDAAVSGRTQSKRKANQALAMLGLPEDDIVGDLMAIRRATGVTGPLSSTSNGKKGNKASKR
ncbi:hypothetical protein GGH12_001308 [Coemansia sp. RSA 1822]|nr:hypothetical protein LPJ76_001459 [Coemansia sp. RSA 638]KAJ2124947.1 hypothetical protein IW147_001333 [Coemansia sp. RSA 720]KAJ2544867.1 hypothetical protein GGF49_000926 [Coemansia sp. RSA 1853]KAJ2565717.1 hypothetical protein GGH12_001308 [Coemansia sp. RSA 1822]